MGVIVAGYCLDSILKVGVGGFYVHLSVIVAVLAIIPLLSSKQASGWLARGNVVLRDTPFLVLLCYIAAHSVFALDMKVYIVLVLYMAVFAYLYWLVHVTYTEVNWLALARMAIVILVVTGLVQYFLMNALGIQLEVRDLTSDYYAGKGELGTRMRGFFTEPNWFGLALFCWIYLYVSLVERLTLRDYGFIFAALAAMFLSQNRITLALAFGTIFLRWFYRPLFGMRWLVPFAALVLTLALYIYYSIHVADVVDRSVTARLRTALNVILIWIREDTFLKLVGHGFSNWGILSNEYHFSVSNFTHNDALTRRDNAEAYVFLFEMGLLSYAVFIYDIYFVTRNAGRTWDAFFISAIYVCGFFYPTYCFMFYLVPFMVVRARIVRRTLPQPARRSAVCGRRAELAGLALRGRGAMNAIRAMRGASASPAGIPPQCG